MSTPRQPKPTDKLSSRRAKLEPAIDHELINMPAAASSSSSSSSQLELDQRNNVNIWMDEIEGGSISSEDCATEFVCSKHRLTSQQLPWHIDDIKTSLTKLVAGETALKLIPTIKGDVLDNIIKEMDKLNISDLLNHKIVQISDFANGAVRKSTFMAENEAASISSPELVLIKWPETCLLVACWLGQYDIVKFLLDRGADASVRDDFGRTPLHLAACAGSTKIVEELLKHKVNPNEWDLNKEYTALHCAATVGNVCVVKCLLKYGANVNAGLSGRSPLHYAVLCDAIDCVEILLKAGACPNTPHVYTETPLHVAASLGSAKSISLLLNHGADIRVQFGPARSTPLHLAAEEGSPECTKLLLEAGAFPDAKNIRGQTALHLAALAQSSETLEILINSGAHINAEDFDGRTPLHAAVAKSLRGGDLVRSLIQAGSQVNKADKFGYTPLHIAALNESSFIVAFLLSKGGDVTARTKGGISALSFIIRRTPDVLPRFVSRMDQAISLHDHELGDVDCELRLDFRPLVPGGRGETDLMLCLVEVGQKYILKHPLCESFLYLKWLRIRKFFLFSLLFHSIFVLIFSAYIIFEFLDYSNETMVKILFWPVLIFTFILAGKEVFQLSHGIFIYVKRWENWLQWSVILVSGILLIKPKYNWQYHVAALGIVLVWIELMMIVGRFPMFGLYVQMFTQVAINFFKFLGAYMCLIIGFSLGFSVLHHNYKSFQNPWISLLKTIIMMSGELEFEDVFFDKDSSLKYLGTSHFMLLTFVVLVTIILTNLMVGLAVSDIQELRRSAGLDRLVRRAELVAHLESMLFSKFLDHCPQKLVRPCRKGALLLHPPHHCAIHIRPNDPREKRLPKDLIKAVYRLVSEKRNRTVTRNNNNNIIINNKNNNNNNHHYNHHNFSYKSNNIDFEDYRFSKICSEYSNSTNDTNKQQFLELIIDLKRCAQSINIRLDSLTNRVESIL